MAHLIDKDALVAEIEKLLNDEFQCSSYDEATGFQNALTLVKKFLNTLEVKEVDFRKELDKEWNKCEPTDEGMGLEIASIEHEQFDNIAKHFFELGMCSTITEEDCKLIWNIGDEIPNMPDEEFFFRELLRRYKAQKGE